MPLFGRSSSAGSSFFSKVKDFGSKAISSIGKVAGGISNVAGKVGGVLNTISSVANSPLAQQIVGAVAPSQLGNLAKVQGALNTGTSLAQQVGSTAGKIQDITQPSTYFGMNPIPAARNAIERVKDVRDDFAGIRASLGTPHLSNRAVGGNPATFTPMMFR